MLQKKIWTIIIICKKYQRLFVFYILGGIHRVRRAERPFFQVQDSILRCARVFQVILYWGAPAWFACTARPLSLKGFGRKVLGLSFQQIPSIDRDVCWGDGLAINIFLKQRLHEALRWWEILVRNFVFKQLVITVKYSAFNKSSLQKRGDDPWCLG